MTVLSAAGLASAATGSAACVARANMASAETAATPTPRRKLLRVRPPLGPAVTVEDGSLDESDMIDSSPQNLAAARWGCQGADAARESRLAPLARRGSKFRPENGVRYNSTKLAAFPLTQSTLPAAMFVTFSAAIRQGIK